MDRLITVATPVRGEMERVAKVAVNPKATQGDLDAAIGPVSNRLLTRYRYAQQAFKQGADGTKARYAAKGEMESLVLFKRDLARYVRVYEFLGQMFDYGNTEFEKLYLFARLLLPLLDYGREREGIVNRHANGTPDWSGPLVPDRFRRLI